MDVFVCWDGDKIGRMVGRAVLSDDVVAVTRIDQAINAGNELWRSYALRHGGKVIEVGGDEGRVQVPASALSEVQDVAKQYGRAVGASVSVGVAMKLSEAAKAQLVAKLRGGDRVLIWDPSMDAEVAEATTPKPESAKIADEYLGKAQPAGNGGAHAGFAGHQPAKGPTHGQKDHDETAVAQDEASAAPGAPEGTHAADFEDQLHDLASDQGEQDRQDEQAKGDHLGEVKDRLVQTLTMVRQQMPLLQQLQQTAPDVYQTIMTLVRGLTDLGREVVGSGRSSAPVQKSEEDLEKSVSQIPHGKRSIQGAGRMAFDYSHVLTPEHRASGLSMQVVHAAKSPVVDEHVTARLLHNGQEVGQVTGYVKGQKDGHKTVSPHSELNSGFQGKGLGMAMYEAAYAHARNVLGATHVSGGAHSPQASATHQRLAQKHGFAYAPEESSKAAAKYGYGVGPYEYALKDEHPMSVRDDEILGPGRGVEFYKGELEKGGAGSSGGTEAGRAHLNLPAGTVKDGAVKVKHADGKMGWKHVDAGMIQGQEADAPLLGQNSHPVSSRSPSSH